jgi:hypothetical protein
MQGSIAESIPSRNNAQSKDAQYKPKPNPTPMLKDSETNITRRQL